ncbi:oligosaccharide flippase family protein [Flavobacteriaceae bacterium KMM 6898]|nr:oligosaccharide flippase family protein [Flavobacteriaceae bacterium KMM 6898]
MFKKLRNFHNTKDGKALVENLISLSSLQIIGMIMPLITLPYLIRVLGFDHYGIVVLAISLIAYFQSITDFSFKITATRDVSLFRDNQKKLNIIYSKVLIVKILFLLISLFIITLIVLLFPLFYNERLVFFLSTLTLVGYTIFPEWFFQGIERMKYITFLNIGIKLFFTVCVFIFIKEEEDYWIYPLLQGMGLIGAGIVGQFIMVKTYKLRFIWLKWQIIKNTIKSNYPIFINQFVPNLYNNTTTFLVGILTGSYLVGIYDSINKVVSLCITLLNIVSNVFFPYLNRRKGAFKKYKKYMGTLSIIMVIGIIAINPLIFWYLNVNYESALIVLVLLAFSIIGTASYNIFGLNYFIIERQDKLVMTNTIIASTIGFILAFPLINYFGIVGAALNLCISRFLMGSGLFFRYLKQNN